VKRESIAHAYILSTPTTVIFLSRRSGGQYEAKKLKFTYEEFRDHVKILTQAGDDFEKAPGLTQEEFNEFSDAALRANNTEP